MPRSYSFLKNVSFLNWNLASSRHDPSVVPQLFAWKGRPMRNCAQLDMSELIWIILNPFALLGLYLWLPCLLSEQLLTWLSGNGVLGFWKGLGWQLLRGQPVQLRPVMLYSMLPLRTISCMQPIGLLRALCFPITFAFFLPPPSPPAAVNLQGLSVQSDLSLS